MKFLDITFGGLSSYTILYLQSTYTCRRGEKGEKDKKTGRGKYQNMPKISSCPVAAADIFSSFVSAVNGCNSGNLLSVQLSVFSLSLSSHNQRAALLTE